MKKLRIISLFMSIILGVILFSGTKNIVFASELNHELKLDSSEAILNSSYTTEDGVFTINLNRSGDILTVYVKDNVNNIESVVTRNLITNEVISDGEEVYPTDFQFRTGNRIYFDINPNSVANAIALIASIPAIVSAVATAGLSWSGFIAGFKVLSEYAGMAALIPNSPSVNGYFDFDQEYRIYNGTPQAKNINRSLTMRVNSGAYETWNYGDGDWFYTSKPY